MINRKRITLHHFTVSSVILFSLVTSIEGFHSEEIDPLQYTSLLDQDFSQVNQPDTQYQNETFYRGWNQPMGKDLHPVFRSLYELANAKHKGKREKRIIRLIPTGSRLLTKYNIIIPVKNVTMYKSSYNFDLYVYFPFPTFLTSRRKRSTDPEEIAHRRKRKQNEKMEIFAQVERALEGFGLPARDCILRLLCDLSEKPLLSGLFGDLVNSIFRPSFHPDDLKETSSLNHVNEEYLQFLEAERHGKLRGSCHKKYTHCPTTLDHLLPQIKDELF